jgi:hypothetical protein
MSCKFLEDLTEYFFPAGKPASYKIQPRGPRGYRVISLDSHVLYRSGNRVADDQLTKITRRRSLFSYSENNYDRSLLSELSRFTRKALRVSFREEVQQEEDDPGYHGFDSLLVALRVSGSWRLPQLLQFLL